ncbi:MAG: hypothetical protein RBS34_00500 [Desulfofustis sp.]|nr:hypothetical protein [Desulfofustis sp.]
MGTIPMWMIGLAIGASCAALFLARSEAEQDIPTLNREVCAELAETAGYESAYTSDGTCWLKLDYGITLPFPQAMDALGFVFRAAETDKLARIHEVRTAHVIGAK